MQLVLLQKKAGRAVARAIGKKASKTAKAAAEKPGDLIRRRLQTQVGAPKSRSRGREAKSSPSARVTRPKMSNNDVNTLINNLIARS